MEVEFNRSFAAFQITFQAGSDTGNPAWATPQNNQPTQFF
jgi:hypothetical protein